MRYFTKKSKTRVLYEKVEKPRIFRKVVFFVLFATLISANPAQAETDTESGAPMESASVATRRENTDARGSANRGPAADRWFRRAETLEDAHAASCRINAGNSRGTGTFFLACGSTAYIVTCQHVVGSTVDVSTDFWGNSVKQNIKGRVFWRYLDNSMPVDVAIIAVDAETLKREVDPPYVPLAGSDARPTVNGFIVSSGAPDGRFTQAWKGKVVEYYQDATAIFSPPPVPGQSGSGIMEYIDGELYITGILTWLIGEKGRDDSVGGAIPVSNIYKAAKKGKRAPTAIDSNMSPIPPNATECSDTIKAVNDEIFRPEIIYYTREDCPACQSIESEIDRLEIDGENINKIDVGKTEGYELAKLDGVEKIPCIVIVQGNERERVEAEELLTKEGAYRVVKRRLQKNDPAPMKNESVEARPITPYTREPVRDDSGAISGILEETERRWQGRLQERQERREDRRQEREEEEKARPAPERLPRDDDATGKESSKLGDRIADRIADALSRKVESEADKLGGALESKISGKLDGAVKQIQNAVVKTILDAINEKIKRAWELTKSAVIVIVGAVALVLFVRKRRKTRNSEAPTT